MKINRKSWHYKFMARMSHGPFVKHVKGEKIKGDGEPKTLCGYFWSLAADMLIVLPFYLLCYAIYWGLYCISRPLCWVLGKVFDPKGDGLFSSWLRAKKEKVCPLIEYED